MSQESRKVIIIGSGPAGYTAAIYAARANLQPLLITGLEKGGQLTTTTDVDNWPGDIDGLQGPALMERLEQHAQKFDTEIVFDNVVAVDFSKRPFSLTCDSGTIYTALSVIIATGACAKYLEIPSETKYKNKGVSACATCDGFFFRGQDVAVIGGGNTAVEETLFLANIAKSVTLVHRRDKLRAEAILVDRLMELTKKNVRIIWDSVVHEIVGDEKGVNGVQLQNVKSHAFEKIAVTGVFIAIGHQPNTQLFTNQLLIENGYIIINSGLNGFATQTSVPGVFAAGDVADNVYRQAITSAGFGCMAALDAEKFLQAN